MSEDLIRNIVWAFVILAGINAALTYALVQLMAFGRPLFQRRDNRLTSVGDR